jgi:hypothetical protein
MPLHKLPAVSRADLVSIGVAFLYFWQPFLDRQAAMQWMIDNVFGGSMASCFGALAVLTDAVVWAGVASPGQRTLYARVCSGVGGGVGEVL